MGYSLASCTISKVHSITGSFRTNLVICKLLKHQFLWKNVSNYVKCWNTVANSSETDFYNYYWFYCCTKYTILTYKWMLSASIMLSRVNTVKGKYFYLFGNWWNQHQNWWYNQAISGWNYIMYSTLYLSMCHLYIWYPRCLVFLHKKVSNRFFLSACYITITARTRQWSTMWDRKAKIYINFWVYRQPFLHRM